MSEPIRLLRSAVIPDVFVHGFPERSGGVSTGLRASLNLGKRWGDDEAAVETNRKRLAEHAGYDPAQLQIMRHVHGTNVWKVGDPVPDAAEFDALVCDRPGPILGAFAADCVPLVFGEPDARVCGSAHAGWRGTVAGVAENVVARMAELGAKPARIRVALGPSIGPCCFEVGPEVVAEFRARFGDLPGLVVRGPSRAQQAQKDHVDLRVALRAALAKVGVTEVDADPPCTRCNGDRFFSYRRDGKDGGMHMGFIGLR